MTDTRNAEDRISLWLEEDAMRHVPDRLLKATYEQTRKSRQQVGWRGFLAGLRVSNFAPALASTAVVVVAVALAFGLFVNRPGLIGPQPSATPTPTPIPTPSPTPDPWAAFIGTFVSDPGDADQGIQTMTVERSGGDSLDVLVVDTIASVCDLAPSTMTGAGHVEDGIRLVIPTPDYTCDDASEPHLLNGDPTPLNEVLKNLTYTLDPASGNLVFGATEVWERQPDPASSPTPAPTTSPDASSEPSAEPTTPGQMWPQTTLEEVRAAQEGADAGDPDYTWQVDSALVGDASPWGSQVLDRFIREGLGWEEFRHGDGLTYGDQGSYYTELVFLRCAAGEANPLYPDDPNGGDCAPTIDDTHYETVMLTLEQPVRRDPSGIWVVTEWHVLEPSEPRFVFGHLYPDFTQGQVEQIVPPTEAEATELLESFLGTRVSGDGAEQYLHTHPGEDPISEAELVPMLLYATTGGVPYERHEIEQTQGPQWPSGWREYKTSLFATDGTLVEQSFAVIRKEDGQLGLLYGYPTAGGSPTSENGQPLPIPSGILEGEVTFGLPVEWTGGGSLGTGEEPTFAAWLGNPGHNEHLVMMANPLPVEAGCVTGPAPANAEALAQSLLSDTDFEATQPVSVTVGGVAALRIDLTGAPGANGSECGLDGGPLVLTESTSDPLELDEGSRMRLYLFDAPEGSSIGIFALAIMAPESELERVVEEATPILDSIQFHAP